MASEMTFNPVEGMQQMDLMTTYGALMNAHIPECDKFTHNSSDAISSQAFRDWQRFNNPKSPDYMKPLF